MSARLQVSTATVKSHTTRIFRKLHVSSRAEAAARFVQFRA
jgi:DNA-binding CsgD family transcriptional regulator